MTDKELKRQGYSKKEIEEINIIYKDTGYRLLFIPRKLLKKRIR
ncbi:MAG: hypothetical protein ACFFAU_01205 [Candidatus Hodarchaeota archaeon]